MKKEDYIQHWNYFCSLTSRLEETKNYVYHGIVERYDGTKELIHGNVYSDYFKQILILSASEFEIVAKALCMEKGDTAKTIVEISNSLLCHFPQIINTEIMTIFWTGTPLSDWEVVESENKKVKGIDWWNAYNSLKHDEDNSYQKATLGNAVSALAALYIINLYLMYTFFGCFALSYNCPPAYFRSKYTAYPMMTGDGLLPDFGDKSPYERANELFPGMFKKPEI